ncbi:MAG: methyltransferase domain-containing protein [Candidatus Dormiibacterota bacterium]
MRCRWRTAPSTYGAVDVLTCALALTHVASLRPIVGEFARVLRPGGQAVRSDMHPSLSAAG